LHRTGFLPTRATPFRTLNSAGDVAKADLRTGEVVDRVAIDPAPRSMATSTVGQSLYVGNDPSGTLSKVNAVTRQVEQTSAPV
jgi:DNA-binding beta-propeller fold protein YncE